MESSDIIRIATSSGPAHCDAISRIVERSGTDIRRCFHCQSCGGGCPDSRAMAYRPDGVAQLLQLGRVREALQSSDIWYCIVGIYGRVSIID